MTYHEPMKGLALAGATISLGLATFMNVLDTTIANVSVPAIAGGLSVSPNQGTWVITSYSVAMGVVVPLAGWLARNFGEVRVFTICTALFSLVSVACGFAWSFEALVFLRVVQGAVAGPMIPLSQSLLLHSYPQDKRGTALAFWAMTTVVAPIAGPILGGWITDNIGWPWIFYINGPVGIIASLATWRLLRGRETKVTRQPVDKVGLFLLILGAGSLQMMLDRGHEKDWFTSPEIVALAVVAVVALCFFIAWELTGEHPVVDLRLFKDRNFTIATLVLSAGFGTFFGGIVIFPLWLQTQMDYTATWAGLASAPTGILSLFLMPVVGVLVHKMDVRYLGTFAFMVFAYTNFWQSGFNTDAAFVDLAMPRFAMGLGLACFFVPMTTLSLSNIPRDKIASAAGLTNFMRIISGGFGASLAISIWEGRMAHHQTHLVENISLYSGPAVQAFNGMAEAGIGMETGLGLMMRMVVRQSAVLATDDIFWLSGMLFLSLIFIIWFSRPVQHAKKA